MIKRKEIKRIIFFSGFEEPESEWKIKIQDIQGSIIPQGSGKHLRMSDFDQEGKNLIKKYAKKFQR